MMPLGWKGRFRTLNIIQTFFWELLVFYCIYLLNHFFGYILHVILTLRILTFFLGSRFWSGDTVPNLDSVVAVRATVSAQAKYFDC